MKLLIVGYGKMGRMVEELAAAEGFEIAGRVDQGRDEWADADVAIDFSTAFWVTVVVVGLTTT